MKKVLFLLTVAIILAGCTKESEEAIDETKGCYSCTVVQTITATPTYCGFPRITTTKFITCGITARNARKFQDDLTNMSVLNTNIGVLTIENVCTLIKTE